MALALHYKPVANSQRLIFTISVLACLFRNLRFSETKQKSHGWGIRDHETRDGMKPWHSGDGAVPAHPVRAISDSWDRQLYELQCDPIKSIDPESFTRVI